MYTTVLCHEHTDLLKLITLHLKKRKLKSGETLTLRISGGEHYWLKPSDPPPLELMCLPLSPTALDRLFAKPIEKLELNHPRYITALRKAGVICIGQLVRMSEYGIGKVKGVGMNTPAQREVVRAIKKFKFTCGMRIPVGPRELKVVRNISTKYMLWYIEQTSAEVRSFSSETREELFRRRLRTLGDFLDMRPKTAKAIFANCKIRVLRKKGEHTTIQDIIQRDDIRGFKGVEVFLHRFCLSIGMNHF